jgi:cytochrome c oxidase subunit 4
MTRAHILPLWQNLLVYATLMVLLGLTVLGHIWHWGTIAALAIASCKAILVALYFMHLRFSSRVVQIAAVVGIIWLAIMLTLSLNDYTTRS